jgi:hypothetical protein
MQAEVLYAMMDNKQGKDGLDWLACPVNQTYKEYNFNATSTKIKPEI